MLPPEPTSAEIQAAKELGGSADWLILRHTSRNGWVLDSANETRAGAMRAMRNGAEVRPSIYMRLVRGETPSERLERHSRNIAATLSSLF